jgi:hypothetical protein
MKTPWREGRNGRRLNDGAHVPFAQQGTMVTKPKNMSTWLT